MKSLFDAQDQRITRLEDLSLKLAEQGAAQTAQIDALGKQITEKLDLVSDHLAEKIETVNRKVEKLESGADKDKSRLLALEDSKKLQEGLVRWFKRYIFPIVTAAGSLGLERLIFHHH